MASGSVTEAGGVARIDFQAGCLYVHGAMVMANARRLLLAGSVHLDGTPRVVDLAGVTQADSSGLALLLEWQRLQRQKGGRLQLRGLPAGLQALADLYDLEALLDPA